MESVEDDYGKTGQQSLFNRSGLSIYIIIQLTNTLFVHQARSDNRGALFTSAAALAPCPSSSPQHLYLLSEL